MFQFRNGWLELRLGGDAVREIAAGAEGRVSIPRQNNMLIADPRVLAAERQSHRVVGIAI